MLKIMKTERSEKAIFNFSEHLGMPGYNIAAKGELLISKHSIPDFAVVLEL